MNKKASVVSHILIAVSLFGIFSGCPDRSMLREYPDLSKQSDSALDETVSDLPEEAESQDAGSAPSNPDANK